MTKQKEERFCCDGSCSCHIAAFIGGESCIELNKPCTPQTTTAAKDAEITRLTAERDGVDGLFTKHMNGLLEALQLGCEISPGEAVVTLDEEDVEALRLQTVGRIEELKARAESAEAKLKQIRELIVTTRDDWRKNIMYKHGKVLDDLLRALDAMN